MRTVATSGGTNAAKRIPWRTGAIRRSLLLAAVCVLLIPDLAAAQDASMLTAADTSSPRATLESFIEACNEVHERIQTERFLDRRSPERQLVTRRILDCLDTSGLVEHARKHRALEVAVCLKEILDRHELPPWDEIPDAATIEAADDPEQFARWRIPGTRVTIARIDGGPRKHEYLISAGTVDRAIDYFSDVEVRPYRTTGPATSPGLHRWYFSAPGHPLIGAIVERLPDGIRYGRSFGLANWKWPGLVIALAVAGALMAVIYRVQFALARRTRGKRLWAYLLTIAFPIAALLAPLVLKEVVRDYLTIRGDALYVLSFFIHAVITLAAIVVAFAVCNRLAEALVASPLVNPQGVNAQLIRVVARLVGVALAVGVFLVGGQYIGIPLATLLTSAGIGGLALALGAQDTLKTLFGTVVLMTDRPFRVGDRISFKDYDGFVEDIGLRSTRIRLLTSHLVTVPNDELARADIENVGRRTCIRRVADIHLPIDTPRAMVETALTIVRKEIENHEGMDPDRPPRVSFVDLLPAAFVLRVIYWYHPPDGSAYAAFSEAFNLAVLRAFEKEGIQFSLPWRVAHTSLWSEKEPIDLRIVEQGDGGTDRAEPAVTR
jgi:MscS family membrane protein